MAAIYSILLKEMASILLKEMRFNFTKRDALSSVYKISMGAALYNLLSYRIQLSSSNRKFMNTITVYGKVMPM
jgi:hypothetical protein